MQVRINEELMLLRKRFPNLEFCEEGAWVRIPDYSLPDGWNRALTEVIFQIPTGYPGTPPYGFYVPSGIKFQGMCPRDYTEPASNNHPFGGIWGVFSWAPDEVDWNPRADVQKGSNLLKWVSGFAYRFQEGA